MSITTLLLKMMEHSERLWYTWKYSDEKTFKDNCDEDIAQVESMVEYLKAKLSEGGDGVGKQRDWL